MKVLIHVFHKSVSGTLIKGSLSLLRTHCEKYPFLFPPWCYQFKALTASAGAYYYHKLQIKGLVKITQSY